MTTLNLETRIIEALSSAVLGMTPRELHRAGRFPESLIQVNESIQKLCYEGKVRAYRAHSGVVFYTTQQAMPNSTWLEPKQLGTAFQVLES